MLRGFTDSTGVQWRVWEVTPSAALPSNAKVLSKSSLKATPFENGWLCFEAPDQKRRLAPVPVNWELQDPVHLEELCQLATPVMSRTAHPFSRESESALS